MKNERKKTSSVAYHTEEFHNTPSLTQTRGTKVVLFDLEGSDSKNGSTCHPENEPSRTFIQKHH